MSKETPPIYYDKNAEALDTWYLLSGGAGGFRNIPKIHRPKLHFKMSEDKNKVARCPHCKAMVLACDFQLSEQDREVRKDFAKLADDGYEIDIVNSETVRKEFGDHSADCPFSPKERKKGKTQTDSTPQPSLF